MPFLTAIIFCFRRLPLFSQNIDREPDLYVQINADEAATYEMVNQVIKALQDARCYRLLFICKRLKRSKTMKAAALRSHLLGICLGASALIQLVILFFFRFPEAGRFR